MPNDEPPPTSGWLVHGAGSWTSTTWPGAPRQFHAVTNTANASSGKLPGAAPMIERHPAAVAARFVMAGNDLNKNVKQTAAKIAEEVVQRTDLAK